MPSLRQRDSQMTADRYVHRVANSNLSQRNRGGEERRTYLGVEHVSPVGLHRIVARRLIYRSYLASDTSVLRGSDPGHVIRGESYKGPEKSFAPKGGPAQFPAGSLGGAYIEEGTLPTRSCQRSKAHRARTLTSCRHPSLAPSSVRTGLFLRSAASTQRRTRGGVPRARSEGGCESRLAHADQRRPPSSATHSPEDLPAPSHPEGVCIARRPYVQRNSETDGGFANPPLWVCCSTIRKQHTHRRMQIIAA